MMGLSNEAKEFFGGVAASYRLIREATSYSFWFEGGEEAAEAVDRLEEEIGRELEAQWATEKLATQLEDSDSPQVSSD